MNYCAGPNRPAEKLLYVISAPLFRKPDIGLGVLLMGAVFSGATVFISPLVADTHALYLMIGIFGFLSLIVVYVSVVYMLSNSLQIRVNGQGVEAIRRIFGIPIVKNVIIHDIVDIEQTMGLQSNTGNKTRVYYKLKLKQKNRKEFVVGGSLSSANSAAYIREQMLAVLNINPLANSDGNEHHGVAPGAARQSDPAKQATGRTVDQDRAIPGRFCTPVDYNL